MFAFCRETFWIVNVGLSELKKKVEDMAGNRASALATIYGNKNDPEYISKQ